MPGSHQPFPCSTRISKEGGEKKLTQIPQNFHTARTLRSSANKPNNRHSTTNLDRLQTLPKRRRSPNLDHEIDAAATDPLCFLAPIRCLFIIEYIIRTEFLQDVGFSGGAGGSDDFRAGCFGELYGEDRYAASAHGEHPIPRLDLLARYAIEGVPGRDSGAAQCCGLVEGEVGGHGHETVFVEGAVLAEGAIDGAAKA